MVEDLCFPSVFFASVSVLLLNIRPGLVTSSYGVLKALLGPQLSPTLVFTKSRILA